MSAGVNGAECDHLSLYNHRMGPLHPPNPRKGRSALLVVLLLVGPLSSCDLYERVHLVRPNYAPIVCEDDADMRYTVHVIWADGTTETRDFVVYPPGPLSTNPDHPEFGFLAGTIAEQDFRSVQFQIYCGKSDEPYLISPQITPADLIQATEFDYYYFVPAESASASSG